MIALIVTCLFVFFIGMIAEKDKDDKKFLTVGFIASLVAVVIMYVLR